MQMYYMTGLGLGFLFSSMTSNACVSVQVMKGRLVPRMFLGDSRGHKRVVNILDSMYFPYDPKLP